jgi:hypothetical protein
MTATTSRTPVSGADRVAPPFRRGRGPARLVLAAGLAFGCVGWPGCGDSSTSPSAPSSGGTASKPTVVLGRPTDSSIVAGVQADAATELYVEYGTAPGSYSRQTEPVTTQATGVVFVLMSGRSADAQYYYRVRYKAKSDTTYAIDSEHFFHTRRAAGTPFTFVIQADPHLDTNPSTAVYGQTLLNELADQPDFMVDLGDTSMVEKCAIDGVVYQEVPQPSLARYDTANPGAGYGYQGSDGVNIFPSSGHLRVTVSATDARVEYVRSVAPVDETATRRNGTIVTGYVIR